MQALVLTVAGVVLPLADKTPSANQVKAGWVALLVFVLLGAAVAFLGFSLNKQLKRTSRAAERGVYGPQDVPTTREDSPREGNDHPEDEKGSSPRS